MKKLVSFLALLCLGFTALACPVSAAAQNIGGTPMVFVHGLAGWGNGTNLNNTLPYWGTTAGDIMAYLNTQGYRSYAASVSPVSSAWDRACELYAHLTGTRTDYGEAHANAHSHDRFGPTYEKLGPDWPNESIHLIGHSFGGATIRLFTQLCAEGSTAERAATPQGELSRLFSGKLGGSIVSVITLTAPHNGTTALSEPIRGVNVTAIEVALYNLAGISALSPSFAAFYPFYLQQFGIARGAGPAGFIQNFAGFDQTTDSAQYDLSVDGAQEVNRGIRCQPDIYYFSYAADVTRENKAGERVPLTRTNLLIAECSLRMGQKRDPVTTPGGITLDDGWLPNDGLVNTISALYPFREPHQVYSEKTIRPGIWQVMPVIAGWDHLDFCGGMRPGGTKGVKEFYHGLAQMLGAL